MTALIEYRDIAILHGRGESSRLLGHQAGKWKRRKPQKMGKQHTSLSVQNAIQPWLGRPAIITISIQVTDAPTSAEYNAMLETSGIFNAQRLPSFLTALLSLLSEIPVVDQQSRLIVLSLCPRHLFAINFIADFKYVETQSPGNQTHREEKCEKL